MHHHIGKTPYDTERSCHIADEINELERTRRHLTRMIDEKIRDLTARHTSELLAQRPEYPTAQQEETVARIARMIHGEETPSRIDHRAITFDHQRDLINIYAQAPYFPTGTARLWELSDRDVRRVRMLLRKHHLRSVDEWIHDDGHAFVVRSTKI